MRCRRLELVILSRRGRTDLQSADVWPLEEGRGAGRRARHRGARVRAGHLSAPSRRTASAPHPGRRCRTSKPLPGREYPSLKIAGFGDVNFSATEHMEGPRGFSQGQFALHMTSALSPRVTFFGEISFSARSDAGTGSPPATGFNAEIERMILRFDRSDQLKVSFGRYHTPINWWNTFYHHGQWLQTSIQRPEMIQFGGRFLPVHFVGALVEGALPAGGLNLNYKAGIGNGRAHGHQPRRRRRRRQRPAGLAPERLHQARQAVRPRARRRVVRRPDHTQRRPASTGSRSSRATWCGTRRRPSSSRSLPACAIGNTTPSRQPTTWSQAFYVQAAYRLPWQERLWKPYFRFEHIGIDPAEVVFATVPDLDQATIGVRFDASQFAAIKGEYRTWTRGSGSQRNQGGFFQICFTF